MAERVYSDYSAAEHYATFCNALAGLEDDAALEGYSQEGRELLLRALKVFDQDRRERHGSYPPRFGRRDNLSVISKAVIASVSGCCSGAFLRRLRKSESGLKSAEVRRRFIIALW